MTARLESGRQETARMQPTPRRLPDSSSQMMTSSGRKALESSRGSARLDGPATDRTDISTTSILRAMKEKAELEKIAQTSAEIDHLKGKYNAFSRPVPSAVRI